MLRSDLAKMVVGQRFTRLNIEDHCQEMRMDVRTKGGQDESRMSRPKDGSREYKVTSSSLQ